MFITFCFCVSYLQVYRAYMPLAVWVLVVLASLGDVCVLRAELFVR